MRAVPIPGEILRTDVFLGLTFDELVTLAAAPLVIIFPSLFIKQIPLVATIGLAVLTALAVVGVVIQTPEGQTPLEWAPAAAKRRLTPDTYYLKPRHQNRDELVYMDVVHTAERLPIESAMTDTMDADDVSEILSESSLRAPADETGVHADYADDSPALSDQAEDEAAQEAEEGEGEAVPLAVSD